MRKLDVADAHLIGDREMPDPRGLWVRDLYVDESRRIEAACSASTIQEFIERLGRPAVDWAVWTAKEVTEGAIDALPRFGEGPGERIALRLGVESGTMCILASILGGRVLDPSDTPEATQSAQEFVHRGISLPEVWASVRRTHKDLTRRLIAACTEIVPNADQVAEIGLLTECGFEFVESLVEGLGQAYTEESERWFATAASIRAETVDRILSGQRVDLEAAGQSMRYEVANRHHLAVILTADDALGDDVALQRTALRWLDAAGSHQTLLVPRGRTQVWAWGNRRARFTDDLPDLGAQDSGMRLAVGRAGHDVAGFCTSHADAQLTQRVIAVGGAGDRTVVDYDSVSLIALLTENESLARTFVLSELGELANDDDPRIRDVRRTLLVNLETHSPQATAARLFVVRNTVSYRLARAAELLGRPITERPLELWVALLLAESLSEDPAPRGSG
jgi:hypothetical protein